MSRIGKMPILVPEGVTVETVGETVVVHGPKGELRLELPEAISLQKKAKQLVIVNRDLATKSGSALHGFVRAELANYIQGVTKGWTKTLELAGVGYRATMSGENLVLTIGFSHPVSVAPPTGITFRVVEGRIEVSGINKQSVGQAASSIRALKKPEPYKGKGIKYLGEYIRKKVGKAAKAIGGAPGVAK